MSFFLSFRKIILSSSELKRLKNHRYSSKNTSVLDQKLQNWWNYVVSFVPLWVAPNLITIIGLFINVLSSILVMWHCPTGTEEPPSWTTLSCGLGLFIYQTLDAIDGKQARRTNTSSPLGELFDHGCDSISTVFVVLASSCSVGLGKHPQLMMIQCLCASSLFYFAHWRTYVTGSMTFGKIDVTEGQFVVIFIMLLSSSLGAGFWNTELFGFFVLRLTPTLIGGLCGLLSLSSSLPVIMNGGAGKNGSTIAGTSVLSPALPLALLLFLAFSIVTEAESKLYEKYSLVVILLFGLIASKITNKLIVAHMCKSEMSILDSILLAPLSLMLNQYCNNVIPEGPLLIVALIFVSLDLFSYCYNVCRDICDSMDVYLFTIKNNTAKGQ